MSHGVLCVSLVPIFADLSDAEQRDVASVARPTPFKRDEPIYVPGGDASQLMVVHTGRVKVSRISGDGHEQIVRILGPGDFGGESAFLNGDRPDHFATALEAGSMCVFRHAELGQLVRRHPSIAVRMLQTVSRRLDETETRLAAVISADVSARLADYLMTLPTSRVDGLPEVELPLAKKEVASLLDTTPESLSRQLRRLSDSKVIIQRPGGHRIALADLDALMALSAGG